MKYCALVLPWQDTLETYRRDGVSFQNSIPVTIGVGIYVGTARLSKTDAGVEADMAIGDEFSVRGMYPSAYGVVTNRSGLTILECRIERVDLLAMRVDPWMKPLLPTLSCECGAAKLGYPPGKIGHSRWCPVARDID